ncbi:hypothetical protein V1477_000770 [Vespula maculifrons]|uniref:Uncharacterized protein n=1 Tax=Vespula maculifrons TaxID=7453 RepID=A0ABD2CZV4_VESMC
MKRSVSAAIVPFPPPSATPLLVAVRTTSLVNDGTSSGNYFEVGTGSTSPTTMTTMTTLTAVTTTIDDNDYATDDRANAT